MKSTTKLVSLAAAILLFVACNSFGEKEVFDGTEVYYTSLVSKEDATKLGNFLVESKFTDGSTKSVQLTKNEETNTYVFRMVTTEKAQNEETYDMVFKLLAMQISTEVFDGKPVDFDVCDDRLNTVKTIAFNDGNE